MKNKHFIYTEEEAKKIYWTSDSHFGHANIIKYCKRPFKDVIENDQELIRRWNEKIPEDGIVFHLGDVGFADSNYMNEILEQLNGKIYLVIGNHDWRRIVKEQSWRFEDMTQQINMKIGDQHIILNHYPLLCFSGSYRTENPTWQLFGHVHTSPYDQSGLDNSRMNMLFPTQYDVGVDNNDFTPVSFNEVKEIINNQKNKSYV